MNVSYNYYYENPHTLSGLKKTTPQMCGYMGSNVLSKMFILASNVNCKKLEPI